MTTFRCEAFIFDLDGLLIDSEPLWQRAEIEIFKELGHRLTPAMCLTTRGRKIDEVIEHWRAHFGFPSRSVLPLRAQIVLRVRELVLLQGRAKTGACSLVRTLNDRGVPCAIASGSDYSIIESALERLDLVGEIETYHSAEDETRGKPDPAVFFGAARKLGVPPATCVVFEDSPGGIAAAKAAGMFCVAVPDRSGGGDPPHAFRDADRVLRSLEDFEPREFQLIRRVRRADEAPGRVKDGR